MKEILEEPNLPSISIFVAARNEQESIGICLESLRNQNYQGRWEVFVADDHSQDNTFEIAAQFCKSNPNFFVLQVPDSDGDVRGKALALGIMASKAQADIFLICDADMEMGKGWASSMVMQLLETEVGMVNGTTTTKGENIFSILQGIDWLLPQGTFAWLSRLDITYTAMGNNMAITRKAYESTGGYLNLPFSLTEDFELFKHAKANGFRLIHFFDTSVLGYSESEKTISDWLNQHVRWMVGFMQLPLSQQWVFYGQLIFYPLFFISFFTSQSNFSTIVQILFLLKMVYEAFLLSTLGKWKFILFLPVYQLTWWPFYFICLLKFKFTETIVWKERVWKK